MKTLLQFLSLALLGALAVLPFTVGTTAEAESRTSGASAEYNACGRCGDGYCSKTCGETATTCPKDCGISSSY